MAIVTKQDAARALADVAGDKQFFCEDGCTSKNLAELANCLSHVKIGTFNHHATSWKNDFSNWVRDVLGDDKLAKDLAKAISPTQAAKIAKEGVAWLQKKAK